MEMESLKRAVGQIQMPDGMRDRLVKNCRTGCARRQTNPKPLLAVCAALLCVICVACSATVVSNLAATAMATADVSGEVTNALMPNDLSFSQADTPLLHERLEQSDYLAVYMDGERVLRVTQTGTIEGSTDGGTTWSQWETEEIPADEFAAWLTHNDPIPGYSMNALQARLSDGAQVKHLALDDKQELYVVLDEHWAQVELVQREKCGAILLDGQRLMLTSAQLSPMQFSAAQLEAFYALLVSNGVLTQEEAQQDLSERMAFLTEEAQIVGTD
jgi:hypothetical protein